MAPEGGIDVMLLWAGVSGLGFALVALALSRALGAVSAWAIAGFWWTVVVIGLVTLLPTTAHVGIVPAGQHPSTCSTDIGGPAPSGFWVLAGGQRLLNTLLFVPSGALLVLGASRWRAGWLLVPLGLAGLAAYSALIEVTQLELARLNRACDLTDVVDNVSGATLGVAVGLVLMLLLRHRRA